MDELVRLGSVKRDYGLGWSRSIAEIFAEDYARLALGATRAQDHLARRAGRDRPRRDQGRSRARAAAVVRPTLKAREHRPRRHPLPARARDDLLRPARPRAPRHPATATLAGRAASRSAAPALASPSGRCRPAWAKVVIDRRNLGPPVHGDAHEHEPVAPCLHARRPARRLAHVGAGAATAASRLARPAPRVSTAAGTPPGSPVSTTIVSGRRASTSHVSACCRSYCPRRG